MKKTVITICALALSMGIANAQLPEAIIGTFPGFPSESGIAQYMATGESQEVMNYFKALKAANEKANILVQNEPVEDADGKLAQQRQNQMMNVANQRADAGTRAMKFFQTLTPEQMKKMEELDKGGGSDEKAMKYLESIGRLDDFMKAMNGVDPNIGNTSLLTKEEQQWMNLDLSTELETVNTKVIDAQSKLYALKNKISSEFPEEQIRQSAMDKEPSGKGGAGYDPEKYKNGVKNYYESVMTDYIKALQTYMDALHNCIPVLEKQDKKTDVTNKVSGTPSLTPYGRGAVSQAFQYLHAAEDIFPADLGEFRHPNEILEDE